RTKFVRVESDYELSSDDFLIQAKTTGGTDSTDCSNLFRLTIGRRADISELFPDFRFAQTDMRYDKDSSESHDDSRIYWLAITFAPDSIIGSNNDDVRGRITVRSNKDPDNGAYIKMTGQVVDNITFAPSL